LLARVATLCVVYFPEGDSTTSGEGASVVQTAAATLLQELAKAFYY
jgi:hypothetical protein